MTLDDDVRGFVQGPNFGTLTTLFADGQPQTQVMWVDADDDHLLINTEVHRAKYRNALRDPRVTVTVWASGNPYRYVEVRGRVVDVVLGDEARHHIDACSQVYLGKPYPNKVTSERAILKVAPDRVLRQGV